MGYERKSVCVESNAIEPRASLSFGITVTAVFASGSPDRLSRMGTCPAMSGKVTLGVQ